MKNIKVDELKNKIVKKRKELNNAIENNALNMENDSILKISKELDNLIIEYVEALSKK